MSKFKKNKRFLEVLKFYLSNLTSRNCKYLYFNCFENPNMLLFTNGDYDLLTKEGYNLSIHLFEILNSELYDEIYNCFKFETKEPYLIHITKCLKIINECLKSGHELKSMIDSKKQILLTTDVDDRSLTQLELDLALEAKLKLEKDLMDGNLLQDDDDTDFEDVDDDYEIDLSNIVLPPLEYSHAFGMIVDDYRNFLTLQTQAQSILNQYNQLNHTPHICIDPKDLTMIRPNVYNFKLSISDFKNENNESIFDKQYKQQYNYLLHDGLDLPSVKEFLIKSTQDWETNLYSILPNSKQISFLSVFKHPDINIISMRPYTGILPILNNIKKDG